MKKLFILLFLLLYAPFIVSAANYDIDNYYIDATLKNNGDMDVKEFIVLNGSFNGYERDIVYKAHDSLYNASSLQDIEIFAKYVSDVSFNTFEEEFDLFKREEYANNGDKSKYILTNLDGGVRLRMYYASRDQKTAFLIKYTLKDVGIYHSDVIEYYWNFIGDSFEDEINDLQIRVNYPFKIKKEEFNWWFHGPLSGSSSIIINGSNTTVLGKVSNLNKGVSVDFRTLLPKSGFNENLFLKKDNTAVKDSIVKAEDAIVKKDNLLRKKAKTIYYALIAMVVSFYILLVILWIFVYKKYDKERKPKFTLEYNREFIDDYNVEVIDYLMKQNITPNAMSASLMNLIYKKNVSVVKLLDKENDYEFTLVNRDGLNDTENYLADFLFNKVGDTLKFTSKQLKKYASSTNSCNTFMNSYTKWKNKVIEDGKKEAFYDKLPGKFGYGLFMLFLAFIIYFVKVYYNVDTYLPFTLIIASFIFIIYIAFIKRKSEKGIEHYARWKAFKKFLNDFASFETKDLPEIILWERYLVYATLFGLAKKVQKDMNVKINELNLTDSTFIDNYLFINNFDLTDVVTLALVDAVSSAQSTINSEIASSASGTFGGHGGGFSSGGGFGGGGGGGRGF